MPTIAVTYTYGGSAEALAEHRPAHREFLRGLAAEGRLVCSGPYDDEPAGALLILSAPDAREALALLDDDPLLREGVITERTARPWTVVIGSLGRPTADPA